MTEVDLCLGRYSCSSGRLGHQKEVGGGARGGEEDCQTGSRENTFIHIKNDKGKNQGKNSQRGFACSS